MIDLSLSQRKQLAKSVIYHRSCMGEKFPHECASVAVSKGLWALDKNELMDLMDKSIDSQECSKVKMPWGVCVKP